MFCRITQKKSISPKRNNQYVKILQIGQALSAASYVISNAAFKSNSSTLLYSDYRYTVECPYCGKRFKRKKRNTKLNAHKDQYGNKCYGRRGQMV